MATIDDLPNLKFSEMSEEDLQNLIRESRGRRATPDPKLAAKSKAIATRRAKAKPGALSSKTLNTEGLSVADLEKILESFNEKSTNKLSGV